MSSRLLYKGLMGSVITPAILLGFGILPAVGQEAFVPVINDVAPLAQAPAAEVFTPLREGSVTSTPLPPPAFSKPTGPCVKPIIKRAPVDSLSGAEYAIIAAY